MELCRLLSHLKEYVMGFFVISVQFCRVLQSLFVPLGKKRTYMQTHVTSGVGVHRMGVLVVYPKTITSKSYKQNWID